MCKVPVPGLKQWFVIGMGEGNFKCPISCVWCASKGTNEPVFVFIHKSSVSPILRVLIGIGKFLVVFNVHVW